MEAAGKETVHFTRDDRVYSFGIGDTIDGMFRIDQATPQGVQLTYLPLRQKRFIAYSTVGAPTAPQTYPTLPSTTSPTGNPRVGAAGKAPETVPNTGTPGIQENGIVNALPVQRGDSRVPAAMAPGSSIQPAPIAPAAVSGASATARFDAEAAAQASAAAAAVMGISPPATSTMPLSAPTITSMPVLAPGADMPISAPTGAPMVVTPPVAR
jgi:hypothetical protein